MTALAANRRGACPALSAPMQTGDGLLVRLQPAAQGLTPRQLIGLCESAQRHGNGLIEVTARGSIQIRGLTSQSAAELAADVDALKIDVRTGVPVEICPLAGLDQEEIADPRPLADAIRTAILTAGLTQRLGPKVSVVVDGGGRFALRSISADIRLWAVERRGRTIWRLALAGDGHTAEPLGATSLGGATGFVIDLLSEIADRGLEARGRDLLPQDDEAMRPRPRQRRRSMPTPMGLFSLRNGQTALVLALPFGSIHAPLLAKLAQAASRLGIDEFRPAPGRTLMALSPTPGAAATLQSAAHAFVTDPTDPRLAISACAGKPACGSGYVAARALAAQTAQLQPDLISLARHIHISGCAKGCAHPAPAAITLVGGENGVGLVVNGTARQKPLAYTRPETLTASLQRLARLVQEERVQGALGDRVLSRLGDDRLAAAFRQDI